MAGENLVLPGFVAWQIQRKRNGAVGFELEALVRQRRISDARLNRALGELLGSGRGGDEALLALEDVEGKV